METWLYTDDVSKASCVAVSNNTWINVKVTWYAPTLSAFINDSLITQIVTSNGIISGNPWIEFNNDSAVTSSTVEIDNFMFKTQK
jgi:hypothetical protein